MDDVLSVHWRVPYSPSLSPLHTTKWASSSSLWSRVSSLSCKVFASILVVTSEWSPSSHLHLFYYKEVLLSDSIQTLHQFASSPLPSAHLITSLTLRNLENDLILKKVRKLTIRVLSWVYQLDLHQWVPAEDHFARNISDRKVFLKKLWYQDRLLLFPLLGTVSFASSTQSTPNRLFTSHKSIVVLECRRLVFLLLLFPLLTKERQAYSHVFFLPMSQDVVSACRY